MEPRLYNGLTLAYIGDSIYELRIRNYVLSKGLTKVNDLNKAATKYTKGEGQSLVMHKLLDIGFLTEEEISMFKKGRNSNVKKVRKNISRSDYLEGTGFESLIGFLYLSNNIVRMDEIIDKAIQIINESEDSNEKTR